MDERLWGAQDEKEDTEQAEGTDDRRTKVSPTASPCSLEKKKRGRREKEREREREREGGGGMARDCAGIPSQPAAQTSYNHIMCHGI